MLICLILVTSQGRMELANVLNFSAASLTKNSYGFSKFLYLRTVSNGVIFDECIDVENLIFTGYVSDEECKALYQNAKAFLHPSKFEGFGTPPLEALSLGTKVAVANATCLPEVYEDSVLYFDPDNYCVEIDEFMKDEVSSPEKILEKCNYDNCAKEIFEYLKNLNY